VWIALPLLAAATLTVACVLPSLVQLIHHEVVDHCVSHPDHHIHLCMVHQPGVQEALLRGRRSRSSRPSGCAP